MNVFEEIRGCFLWLVSSEPLKLLTWFFEDYILLLA